MQQNQNPELPLITQTWQQQQAEDFYQDQRHINRSIVDAQIQSQKEIAVYEAKQQIAAQHARQQQEQKRWLKEYEDELRRNRYDEISLTADGRIAATVQNLYAKPAARIITNIQNPNLECLVRLEDLDDFAYRLNADVGNSHVSVYLSSTGIGDPGYLLKKFTLNGILLYADNFTQQKLYARILIAFLLSRELETSYVPECTGWSYFFDLGFYFSTKEELTWKKILKIIK